MTKTLWENIMKRKMLHMILFAVILLFFNKSVHSVYLSIGIKGGGNLAKLNFNSENTQKWKSLTGYSLGGFFKIDLSEKFSIQPEILYSLKGTKTSGTFLGQKATARIEFTYIEIPVLAKYSFSYGKKFNPALFAGGYFAFNAGAKQVTEFSGETETEDIKGDIRKNDYGFLVGLELSYALGKGRLLLDIRFSRGIVDIRNLQIGDVQEDPIKNEVISLMLGYIF